MPSPSLSLREQAQRASALSHPLLEKRVQELVPGIDERGMHANRPLIFGARRPEPAQDAVLMWSNDWVSVPRGPVTVTVRPSTFTVTFRGTFMVRVLWMVFMVTG